MESKKDGAGASLETLMSSFNTRISELQQLVIARNMYPTSSISDLSAIDNLVMAMEVQVQQIKNRLREEKEAIPKAKKLIEASLQQQRKLQRMSAYVPSNPPERSSITNQETRTFILPENNKQDIPFSSLNYEEPAALPKEKKGRCTPPLWYITADELNSLSSYMKGRLTLEKVNAAISDMATYAEANAQLVTAPRKKLTEANLDRAMELREIAGTDSVKGKHFFLETDIKGPSFKLDNTGKATLTKLQDWEEHIRELEQTKQQLKLSLDNVRRYHQTLLELNTKLKAKRDQKNNELKRKNLPVLVNGGFDLKFQTGHHQFPAFARQQQQQQKYQQGSDGLKFQYYPVQFYQTNAKLLQAAEARHRRKMKINTRKNSNTLGIRSSLS